MKKPTLPVVRVVAWATALAALAPSLIANVEPVTCLLRGGAGFLVGKILAEVWCALFPANRKNLEYLETEVPSLGDDLESERSAA